MSHPFPCPKCGYEGKPPVGPVWKVYTGMGRGECISCGYTLDDKVIRKRMLDGSRAPEHYCTHRWAETGMIRSWCAKCKITGEFDVTVGDYLPWKG
jgi:hypothetical protein